MIHLDTSTLIRRGTARVSHHHPENSALIIKIPFQNNKEGKLANAKELKGYYDLIRSQLDLTGISHCYGYVTTNKGTGLLCDCIRDSDGRVSKTIWEILLFQDSCDMAFIKNIAKDFCDYLIRRDIFIFDINPKNIMLRVGNDGTYEPVAIDLKGRFENHEFIPYATYIKYFARKKMKRRIKELMYRIDDYRARRIELQKVDALIMQGKRRR